MDLGRYIHQLLKHRNEVYVKGLGVFKRIHTPSVYDDRRGVYLPPVTYLEFDGKSTDGVDFIDYIQQSKQISRQSAEAEVHDVVLNLLETIKENGSVTLNHLGQLIKHGSSLVFKAEDLSGFQLQPIEGAASPVSEPEIKPEPEIEVEEEQPQAEEPEESVEEPVVAVAEQEIVPEIYEEPQAAGKSKWYIWAAVVAIVVIAGLFYLNHTNSSRRAQERADSILNAGIAEPDTTVAKPVDTSSTVTTPIVDSTANTNTETGKKVYNPLIPANHTYQIVIGTHATLAQAYEQAESFNKAGIESVRVIPSNLAHNKKKVIWDSYETKEQADSALKYVRKHYVADAWHQKINK